jgi:hypothetical protein
MYEGQVHGSKLRNHPIPDYSSTDLRLWCYSQPIFHKLFDDWVNSGYKKDLKPSCDRLNDYKGYSFSNIRLVTWSDNYLKSRYDLSNGTNTKVCKTVIQMDMAGNFVKEFFSAMQAQRETGICSTGISRCCTGKSKTSGGFRWEHSIGENNE